MEGNQLIDKDKFLSWIIKEIEVQQKSLIDLSLKREIVQELIEIYTLISDGKFDHRGVE